MIAGPDIAQLVDLLNFRNVLLYHACQYQDFLSYLRLGGVPSRKLLETNGDSFTTFETDGNDRVNGVWDKVFINLQDFGEMFGNGQNAVPNKAVPNVYGPILLCIWPESLLEALDVAVCLRSAGARDFDRDMSALRSVNEIDGLFQFRPDVRFPLTREIKRKEDLRTQYCRYPTGGNPEVSCTFQHGLLPLTYVGRIVVDPYVLRGRPLLEWVGQTLPTTFHKVHVRERTFDCPDRGDLYTELGVIISSHLPTLSEIQASSSASDPLRSWARSLTALESEYRQFTRYVTYLRNGTILPIVHAAS